MDYVVDNRRSVLVDVLHEGAKAGFGIECLAAEVALFVGVALVCDGQRDAGVEKRQVAQTVGESLIAVFRYCEYRSVGMENDCRPSVIRLAYNLDLCGRLSISIFLNIQFAITTDLGTKIVGKRIHAGNTDAVQTARHLVGAFVEFATSVEHRQHNLKSRLMLFLVHVDGYAAAVIDNLYGIVFQYGDVNVFGKSGQCLVDRIVDHFIHQMVESALAYVADIHCRALSHRFKPLKDLNVMSRVVFFLVVDVVNVFCHVIVIS